MPKHKNLRGMRCYSPIEELPLEVEIRTDDDLDLIGSSLLQIRDSIFEDSPYTCELCGRSFPNITGLRTHERSHKNIGVSPSVQLGVTRYSEHSSNEDSPYTCELCSRSFPNMTGLRTHERSHRKQPIVNHRICSTSKPNVPTGSNMKLGSPNRSDVLKTQLISLPLETTITAIPDAKRTVGEHADLLDDSMYECGRCSKIFQTPSKLKLHLEVKHAHEFSEEKYSKKSNRAEKFWKDGMFYVCKCCGSSYLHIVGFRSHWRRHEREVDMLLA